MKLAAYFATIGMALLGSSARTAIAQSSPRKPPAPLKAAARDTLPPLTWAIGRDEVEVGATFDAWLAVRAPSVRPKASAVTLSAPAGVALWFRGEGETCAAARSAGLRVDSSTVVRDTLFYVCGLANHAGATRVAATHRAEFPNNTSQAIAVSDAIHVVSKFAPGPGLLALWTALIGLAGGVSSYWIQRGMDTRAQRNKNITEMQKQLAQQLVEEMRTNRDKLLAFTSNSASLPPPDLSVGQYLALLADDGLYAYLNAAERASYFAKTTQLYQMINAYSDMTNAKGQNGAPTFNAAAMLPHAQLLLAKLSSHITTLQP